jgi:hypothetical protein
MFSMKNLVAAAALTFACAVGAASAQTVSAPTTQREAMIFALTQSGDAWQKDTAASLSPKFLIGKPMVLVYNPFDETINRVGCDNNPKWDLVGPAAYNKDLKAPVSIAPHQAVLIPTNGFDNYCKQSITAYTEKGNFPGILTIKGDFSNSTAITFYAGSSPDAPRNLKEAKSFLANMSGAAWQKYVVASLQLDFLIGKPVVAVFNPTDDEIQTVTCDGKYSLVGPNAMKGAPATIASHTVAFIPTDGYDKYCMQSILAVTENGSFAGHLDRPGDFTHSTKITFDVTQN